jgi:hypothetical protein
MTSVSSFAEGLVNRTLTFVTLGVTLGEFGERIQETKGRQRCRGRKTTSTGRTRRPGWLTVVIELPPFTLKWGRYQLTEADRTIMLEAILSDPEAWPVQRGTTGARKARFSSHDLDSGTSGGYRVFDAVFRKYGKHVHVTLFPKNERSNLSKAGQNLVATLLRKIERELAQVDREEKAGTLKKERNSS